MRLTIRLSAQRYRRLFARWWQTRHLQFRDGVTRQFQHDKLKTCDDDGFVNSGLVSQRLDHHTGNRGRGAQTSGSLQKLC